MNVVFSVMSKVDVDFRISILAFFFFYINFWLSLHCKKAFFAVMDKLKLRENVNPANLIG